MQFDFERACTSAREHIPVPEFSLAAIRARRLRVEPDRRVRRSALVTIAAGFAMVAVAAAAVITSSHFTITKSGGLVISAGKMVRHQNPTDDDLRAAVAKADFRVVLPTGLPQGTHLRTLWNIESTGILLGYDLPGAWRASHHYMNVVIVNPSALQGSAAAKPRMNLQLGGKQHNSMWKIGGEVVFIQTSVLTVDEAARIKASMQKEAAR